MTNYHLLESAASTGKPLIVSTGMHSMDEVEDTKSFLEEHADEFSLLYCVSKYPTQPSDFDLGTINRLRELTDVVGFSDHSLGAEASKIAICNGAEIVEKHFTIDRRLPGSDQDVSIEPNELSDLCSFAQLYHDTSDTKDELYPEESDIKDWARHSIVTSKRVNEGEEFNRDNITTKRPGTGLPAKEYFEVIGKVADRKLSSDSVVYDEDVR
jgi:N-acetylneuraminate synthase/N,N'-diacetyllegionaminate synthase